jgi:hypothetical protein
MVVRSTFGSFDAMLRPLRNEHFRWKELPRRSHRARGFGMLHDNPSSLFMQAIYDSLD